MDRFICVTCACCALLAALPSPRAQTNAEEQRDKAVTAVRATDIVVDGQLLEPGWRDGPWYTGFTMAGSRERAEVQTRFAVRFDDANLYFGAAADEPNVAELRRGMEGRDVKVFRDDCVEFMVDPTGDRVEYYHFAVNVNGALYDARVMQGGHVMSKEWSCDANAAGSVGDNAFAVEIAVPFVELGLAPRSAEQPWAVQVTRERHAGGRLELSSYIDCGGSFHVPATYAPLTLAEADLRRFLWDVKAPIEDMVTADGTGLTYRVKALVTNGTGQFRFTTVTASLRGDGEAGTATRTGGHDEGQQQPYVFDVPFREPGSHVLRLALADRRRPDVWLAVRSIPVQLSYTPMRLRVTRPFYRNTIYATEDLRSVVVEVDIRLPAETLRGARLAGTLVAEGGSDAAPLASTELACDTGKARLDLPVGGLADGRCLLTVTATLANGETFDARKVIHKVPAVDHEWRFDENFVLRHNGEPFLLYGWFSAPAAEGAKLRGEGVTAVQNYNAQWAPPEKTLAWLDQLAANGLYGCFYPWPSNAFMKNHGEPVSAAEEDALRQRVRAFRDHPALFAYYMWDEPELRPMLVERSTRLYEIVAEEDPYHPCIMLNNTIRGIHEYRDGGDVLMPDPYPLFSKGAHAGRPIEYTSKFMHACREASRGEKAWWITPQAFDHHGAGEGSRCPNFAELRNQQLQAIINGARGILWYTHSHRYNYEDLDIGMPFLGLEAQRLRAAILAPEQPNAVAWRAGSEEHIQATVRSVGDDVVVFAVNTLTAPQDVELTLERNGVRTLWVVAEGRAVSLEGGRFSDRFGLYEGHIYTSRRELAEGGATIAETKAAIARAVAERHKPGNLAFGELGTTLTASSTSPYSGALSMVVDGKVKGKGWTDNTWKGWPDWIEVAFPEPVTAGRVVVYTRSIADYDVQVEQDGKLSTVATGTRTGDAPITAGFPPRRVHAVRVVAKAGTGTRTSVSEIEVYAE